ncbi:MAG: hypothetical protein HYR63_00110 [Proteobacteria bacterium]|nr:hypothetical protein [Pseudomonadota bacterium]MBI3498151.1 hypothetical protein [Pseudomonadota bacterium]
MVVAIGLAAALFAWTLGTAEARVTAVEITTSEPFAAGASFGAAGSYLRLVGKAKGELDPRLPVNRGIVNLDKVPVNARGMVEYETDLFILRPADPAKGNGKILYEVNNRGRKLVPAFLLDAPDAANEMKSAADAGNGFALKLGYTLVWSGWDPDAPRANGGLAMSVPVATDGGRPVTQRIRDQLVSGTRAPQVDVFRLSYEAASLDQTQATLTLRRKDSYPESVIPISGWAFADARSIRLLPAGTKPEPGTLYELRYEAKNPKVTGIGFAATRDVVSYLKHAEPRSNPAGGPVKAALAIGISQSGRYLRDHIGQGFNKDENGQRVFDGVLAHISGVGRVFHNAAFAQAFRTNTQHEDHAYPENEFPFSSARTIDPVTHRSASLLRGDGSDPLLIEVNTSTEYWQKGASLLHTDPLGRRDLMLPATARVFMIAGTQHGGRAGLTTQPGPCVNPRNPHSSGPVLRALLVALDRWAGEGIEPPASRVPSLTAGTLVQSDRTGFPAIPGAVAVRETNRVAPLADWVGPKWDGVHAYRTLVPKVDATGNEVAGIRLPDIVAPIATYTGWNQYKSPFPDGEICDRDGSYLPLPRTRTEREAKADPRPSLEELYGSHETYVARVSEAAAALVSDRLLLPEDAQSFVAAARAKNPLRP